MEASTQYGKNHGYTLQTRMKIDSSRSNLVIQLCHAAHQHTLALSWTVSLHISNTWNLFAQKPLPGTSSFVALLALLGEPTPVHSVQVLSHWSTVLLNMLYLYGAEVLIQRSWTALLMKPSGSSLFASAQPTQCLQYEVSEEDPWVPLVGLCV